jgi:hypothetical protein
LRYIASKLWASTTSTATIAKLFERRIGEPPEPPRSTVHTPSATDGRDPLWDSELRELHMYTHTHTDSQFAKLRNIEGLLSMTHVSSMMNDLDLLQASELRGFLIQNTTHPRSSRVSNSESRSIYCHVHLAPMVRIFFGLRCFGKLARSCDYTSISLDNQTSR